MDWKPIAGIVYYVLLLAVILYAPVVLGILAYFRGPSNRRSANVLGDGGIEFAPNGLALWAWGSLEAFGVYAACNLLMHSQWKTSSLAAAAGLGYGALSSLFSFPGSVVVSAEGLEEIYWLRPHKRIRWEEIVEVNTGEKSRTVTITGGDGAKIVHTRLLADRPRFLLEIKQHCGSNLPPDFPHEPLGDLEDAGES